MKMTYDEAIMYLKDNDVYYYQEILRKPFSVSGARIIKWASALKKRKARCDEPICKQMQ